MISWIRNNSSLLLVVLALVFWGGIFYIFPPSTLIDTIGIENSYLVSFGIALLAGFSTFSGTAAYAAVIEFSRGGANPLYLGVASGIGLFISDSIFYILIVRGRESVENRLGSWLQKFQEFIDHVPNYAVYIIVYLFCAFGPIPNDVVLATLMVAGYEYKRIWPVILAGDLTFMLFLSYLFQQ